MITEDYVSFDTAKLLKEKGFNEKCRYVWELHKANVVGDTDGISKVCSQIFMEGESSVDNSDIERVIEYNGWSKSLYEAYLCPTLQVVRKWLLKKYNIFISVLFLEWKICSYILCTHYIYWILNCYKITICYKKLTKKL